MRLHVLRLLVAAVVLTSAAGAVGDEGPPDVRGDEPAAPQVVDPPGDANGLNGQGLLPVPGDSQTQPASLGSHDILTARVSAFGKYKYATVNGRRVRAFAPQGLTVTLELAEAPQSGAYRVFGHTPLCDMVAFQYFIDVTETSGWLRHTCTDTGAPPPEFYDVPVSVSVVNERFVVWKVSLGQLPKQVAVGTLLQTLSAQTLGDGGVVTFPVVDEVVTDSSYRVGDPT